MKIVMGIILASVFPLYVLGGLGFPREYLEGHNAARASVGVRPLQWTGKLVPIARTFLNKHIEDCLEGNLITLTASPYYGQNTERDLVSKNLTAAHAVASWVAQKRFYNYKSNSCIRGKNCRAYTQVVWSKSTHIGCAGVQCQNGGILVTCIYRPAGNIPGERPY